MNRPPVNWADVIAVADRGPAARCPLPATAVIAILPVALGLVAQKEIVQGLSAGAVK